MVWHSQILRYELLRHARRVTVGPSKHALLIAPAVSGRSRFVLARPKSGGYLLQLAPGMSGDVQQGGQTITIDEILSGPATRRRRGDLREVTIQPGDRARIHLRDAGDLRIELRFVDEPETIGRPRHEDPLLRRITTTMTLILGLFATVMTLMWSKQPPRTLAISAERLVKLEKPIEQAKVATRARAEKKKEEQKAEEGQVKKAKEKTGKIGRSDAKPRETVITKGEKDVLREKVAKTGLLGLIGTQKREGSGISKLFAESNDIEQAIAGMAGAKVVAGHGAGGLTTSGAGSGGGGTGYGHIYGAGNLDTGGRGAKGHGRGPKLVERGEKEVKVGVGLGNGEADGSLSREQIDKVVRAHKSGVSYCYEKELQRKASLAGTITIFWSIQPDGTVSKANVKTTSMSDAAVEGCILRQVKQWAFPKAPAQTHVNYPFIFKGGT
ncbi:MAG TPA: AgmX/PglI C-terminal domain-containing protein [Polyangia bacterium]|nr:AgmX/PglI C-terminal domain-containing protein [Polyangia bacterium]